MKRVAKHRGSSGSDVRDFAAEEEEQAEGSR